MTSLLMRSRVWVVLGCAALAVFGFAPSSAKADVTLTAFNTSLFVDTDDGFGVGHWLLSGRYAMFNEWFWVGVGAGAENPLGSAAIPLTLEQQLAADILRLEYVAAAGTFRVDVILALSGGSHSADLAESIRVTNLTNSNLSFRFYEYADFFLEFTPNDVVSMVGVTPFAAVATQTDVITGMIATTTINSSHPISRYELAEFPTTYLKLTNGVADDLASVYAAPFIASLGPGEPTWALQWNVTLGAGRSFVLSKDKLVTIRVIPEPASLVLVGLGLPMLVVGLRRSRKAA